MHEGPVCNNGNMQTFIIMQYDYKCRLNTFQLKKDLNANIKKHEGLNAMQ